MNPDEAGNNRWVNNVAHFCVSVTIAWKYLKAKHIMHSYLKHFSTYQSLFPLFLLSYYYLIKSLMVSIKKFAILISS